jgi:type II secretory pathway pseudopilin PulG
MIALGAVGYQAYLKWAPVQAVVPLISDAPALALQVERHGTDLRVRWNRYSKAVRQATAAVLAIRDGDLQQQELRLEHEQLLNGSVLYTPANTTVQFRLEITTAPDNTKMSETVLALTAAKSDLSRGLVADDAPPAGKPPAPRSPSPGGPSAGSPQEGDSSDPVRVVMVNGPAQPNETPKLPAPARPENAATEHYVPPHAIREVQPSLPPNAAKDVTSLVEVDIRVHINESGRVIRAESLPKNEPVSSFLVGAARNAALLWRFEPARRGGRSAASEVVLRFQYRPAARE